MDVVASTIRGTVLGLACVPATFNIDPECMFRVNLDGRIGKRIVQWTSYRLPFPLPKCSPTRVLEPTRLLHLHT